jgi:hypothetical protein
MFLNIITPCSRPKNLLLISESINIPKENYRWIVVFDGDALPDKELIPDNCEFYTHRNPLSVVGHSQRNYAMEMIKEGHIYSNDDDTILHSELWDNIKDLDNNDFISFMQGHKGGGVRLRSDKIYLGGIDSHNFILSKSLIGETIFDVTKYDADGHFASECYSKSKTPKYIPKILSIYNYLR